MGAAELVMLALLPGMSSSTFDMSKSMRDLVRHPDPVERLDRVRDCLFGIVSVVLEDFTFPAHSDMRFDSIPRESLPVDENVHGHIVRQPKDHSRDQVGILTEGGVHVYGPISGIKVDPEVSHKLARRRDERSLSHAQRHPHT
jgi:hypothetical protein